MYRLDDTWSPHGPINLLCRRAVPANRAFAQKRLERDSSPQLLHSSFQESLLWLFLRRLTALLPKKTQRVQQSNYYMPRASNPEPMLASPRPTETLACMLRALLEVLFKGGSRPMMQRSPHQLSLSISTPTSTTAFTCISIYRYTCRCWCVYTYI